MPLMGVPTSKYPRMLYDTSTLVLWRALTGIAPDLTSRAWSVANQAVYVPVWLDLPIEADAIRIGNGASVVSGLFQVGIYAPDSYGRPGTAYYRSVSVSQVAKGQSVYLSTNMYIPAGLNYLAFVLDNTTGTVLAQAAGDTTGKHVYLGNVFKEANAMPLPAIATPDATPATLVVPIMAILAQV